MGSLLFGPLGSDLGNQVFPFTRLGIDGTQGLLSFHRF